MATEVLSIIFDAFSALLGDEVKKRIKNWSRKKKAFRDLVQRFDDICKDQFGDFAGFLKRLGLNEKMIKTRFKSSMKNAAKAGSFNNVDRGIDKAVALIGQIFKESIDNCILKGGITTSNEFEAVAEDIRKELKVKLDSILLPENELNADTRRILKERAEQLSDNKNQVSRPVIQVDDFEKLIGMSVLQFLKSGKNKLDLSKRRLEFLHKEIGSLSSLQILHLQKNNLSSLPMEVGSLSSLQDLDLSHNNIGSLPRSFWQLSSLQTLDLRSNDLSALPKAIGQLTSLKILNLRANHLTYLPEEIGQLTSLQRLDLRGNLFSSLSEEIKRAIKRLNEQGCKVLGIWSAFGSITATRVVHVTEKAICVENSSGVTLWIPKSQIVPSKSTPNQVIEGPLPLRVKEWFARKSEFIAWSTGEGVKRG